MNRITVRRLKLLVLFSLCCTQAYSQASIQKNSILPDTLSKIESYFNHFIGQQSPLFNGKEYQFYPYSYSAESNAYFEDAKFFKSGSVVYDGYLYPDIPLIYDLYQDLLIGVLNDGFSKYSLISEKVSAFKLYDHHFVYLKGDSAAIATNLKPGFYDMIYSGKLKILVKRTKEWKQTSGSGDLRKYFLFKKFYYLQKEGIYYAIHSESSLLNLFKEEKKELQRHLQNKKVKFRQDPEQAMVIVATYYDSLSN